MARTNTTKTDVAVINTKLDGLKEDMTDIKFKLSNDYATKEELRAVDNKYGPTQRIVYGLVGLVVVTVMGALLAIVVVQPNL